MRKDELSERNRKILLAKAGGQCELDGCTKFIYEDTLTKREFIFGQYAHIIGDSPDGPRGDVILSDKYCADMNNIMLLCPEHHKMIDMLVEKYSVEDLHKMKKAHEDRVRRVLSIGKDNGTNVLLFAANVGQHNCLIGTDEAYEVLLHNNRFPNESTPIEIGLVNSISKDDNNKYWEVERYNLEENFKIHVAYRIAKHDIKKLAVFAIAPMPLLVDLGTLLSDKFDIDVYQLHKEPPHSWDWQNDDGRDFEVIEPEGKTEKPVIVFSLSADIMHRIEGFYEGQKVSIWQMTIPKPNNDYLKSKKQLEKFKTIARALLEDVNQSASAGESVDVHMSMSVACAVALGMVRNGKADRKLNLFDYNNGVDKYAFTI